jgi:branched-chain amino acid aminotransferase
MYRKGTGKWPWCKPAILLPQVSHFAASVAFIRLASSQGRFEDTPFDRTSDASRMNDRRSSDRATFASHPRLRHHGPIGPRPHGSSTVVTLANQRLAYLNGEFLPEQEVRVSFRDRGFKYGDAVFDMTRSFGHRIFRLKEHIDRFYRSLSYVRIDPGMAPKEMIERSEECFERNRHLLAAGDDYWLGQRVSRGTDEIEGEPHSKNGPTVIIECTPLPLRARAPYYKHGIEIIVPSVRRVAPDMLSPRAKSHNYLNMIVGEQEAKAVNPAAWAVLLDVNGNLSEGIGSNIFIVREGQIVTPHERFVLPGVSRAVTIELAQKLNIPLREADIDLFDAYVADEAFVTSTSFCICPIRSINGHTMTAATIPGPITKKLIDAYIDLVKFDWLDQYLRHASS